MCGILGYSANIEKKTLSNALQALHHRGPDDQGIQYLQYKDQFIGLAHARLSIIDLSPQGHQPMTVSCPCCQKESSTENQKLWLIFNGEIYNFQDLRKDLEAQGHQFHSHSDSEVLIHLYAQYGLKMFSMLNGVFAFVLYDGRPSGQKEGIQPGDLILVRDNVGVKPLYYSQTQHSFSFSSELKALLKLDKIDLSINYTALDAYMKYLWCPAPDTLLQNVHKFKPGEVMIVREGKIHRQFIYEDIPQASPKPLYKSFDEAKKDLLFHLENSVKRQLISDAPLGAFLSGGLDSSSVVAMMKHADPERRFDCFTMRQKSTGHQDGFTDDLSYAKKVADRLDVRLHEVEIDEDILKYLPKMIYHLDEPTADPAAINTMLICEQAQSMGIKVLMAGTGGDDIFTGYRRHQALQLEKYWSWMPQRVKTGIADLAQQFQSGQLMGMSHPTLRRLTKLLSYIDLPKPAYLESYFCWNTPQLRRSLYSQEMLNHSLLNSLNHVKDLDPINQMLYLEQKHFLADHNLNYTDKMSMACGVEVRVPLLDKELLQFATSLPTEYKMQDGKMKYIFNEAMRGILPDEVIHRPKSGFGAPLRNWFQKDSIILDILNSESLKNRGIFNPTMLQKIIQQQRSGKIDAAYTLFAAACIELWMQTFIDQNN